MTTVDPDSEFASAKTALANELRRRKRVFGLYMLLVLVPVFLAGWAVVRAPSETKALATEIQPALTEEVGKTIKPRVEEAVARQAGPIIRERVTTEVRQAVDSAVAPVVESTGLMGERYIELDAEVAELGQSVERDTQALQAVIPRMAELDALESRVAQAERDAREALHPAITALQQEQSLLRLDITANAKRDSQTVEDLAKLTKTVEDLKRQVAALEKEVKSMRENTRFRVYHRPPPKTQ